MFHFLHCIVMAFTFNHLLSPAHKMYGELALYLHTTEKIRIDD